VANGIIARFSGTAIKPGVSKNGRLYTRDAIAKAVVRAQERLAEGQVPVTVLTHHDAEDDSTRIVGHITSVRLAEDGSAKYDGVLEDVPHGHTIGTLIDNSKGKTPSLRGMSIRGAWAAPVRTVTHEGQRVTTADDLELDGLDFTRKPGVTGAGVESFEWADGSPTETVDGRALIYESAPEADVTFVEEAATVESSTPVTANEPIEEKGAPALKSGKAAAPQTKAKSYADPGYQDDKAPRYALDTKAQAKAAWSYINQPKNAKLYTANQLKRVKQRIMKALEKFGVKVDTKEHLVIDSYELQESEITEYYGDIGANGSFCVELTNGPVRLCISSYCIDPADLDVVGRAAMDAACTALKALDPDMDGDIDIDGASAEDTDHDTESAPEATESTTDTATTAATTETAAPAADPNTTEEATVVTDEAPKAVEQNADADKPSVIDALNAKFDSLTAAITGMVEKLTPAAPAAVAAESAETDKPAVTETATKAEVTESEDDRIARLVAEGIAKALPNAVQEHVEQNGVQRKGLVANANTNGGAVNESTGETVEYPDDWPKHPQSGLPKQPHEMTPDEFAGVAGPTLLQYVTKGR
jgi:hypothetical protein